jgi:hypothetical protein
VLTIFLVATKWVEEEFLVIEEEFLEATKDWEKEKRGGVGWKHVRTGFLLYCWCW